MIIIDYQHLIIDACSASLTRIRKIDIRLVRMLFLTRLSKLLVKFKDEYGYPVICDEGGGYWRRDDFKQYKINRKAGRDDSSMDWDQVYDCANVIAGELRNVFKYPVLSFPKMEADDSIASIIRSYPQNHVIISRDSDFLQLNIFGNVKQWDVVTKSFLQYPNGVTEDEFYLKMIVKGQGKDGIPNMFSDDYYMFEKIRQKPIQQKMLDAIRDNAMVNGDFDIDLAVETVMTHAAFAKAVESTGISEKRLRRQMTRNKLVGCLRTPPPIAGFDERIKNLLDNWDYAVAPADLLSYFVENNLDDITGKANDFVFEHASNQFYGLSF